MLKRGNASMMVGASSWKDQFVDAFTVQAGNELIFGIISFILTIKMIFIKNSLTVFIHYWKFNFEGDDDEEEEEGGDEEGEEGEEKMPTCGDYIMHFLTLFWKVIFATIPPAGKPNFLILFFPRSVV